MAAKVIATTMIFIATTITTVAGVDVVVLVVIKVTANKQTAF